MRRVGVISDRGWSREFDDPIVLPEGEKLRTLRDAATYVTGLPKKEAALPEWQTAIEALMAGRFRLSVNKIASQFWRKCRSGSQWWGRNDRIYSQGNRPSVDRVR
jgi:hypothetical protein